jgi:hypothetical protein
MAPHSPLQCTPGNKNVSAAQQDRMVNLLSSGDRGRIAVLPDLSNK